LVTFAQPPDALRRIGFLFAVLLADVWRGRENLQCCLKKSFPMESEIIIYQSEDGNTKVEVRLEGETVWLTLNQ